MYFKMKDERCRSNQSGFLKLNQKILNTSILQYRAALAQHHKVLRANFKRKCAYVQ